jgi:hypothetical protein
MCNCHTCHIIALSSMWDEGVKVRFSSVLTGPAVGYGES